MADRPLRLGDVVDDYCSRCKLLMNHGIMAMAGEAVVKVRCNTCMYEHPFRHGRTPKKRDPVQAAYEELLGKFPMTPAPKKPPEED